MKVLIVAEHASATFGGEALIPLQYFKHLRGMNVDVHLLVHDRTRRELQALFPEEVERLHFVPDSLLNTWCCKLRQFMPERLAAFTVGLLSYFHTEFRQRRMVQILTTTADFNLIHQPIPVSPKLPSMIFGLSVPVLIGPMNGGMDYPKNYNLAGDLERLVIFVLRATSAFWNALIPGKRQATALLVANQRTFKALPSNLLGKRVIELVENGVDLDVFKPASARHVGFHIIYVGRLVDFKRVDLLIDACAKLNGRLEFRLDVVGDGPLRGTLQEQVRRLSLVDRVRFHGWVPQEAASDWLRNADVMCLPSMRECGGAVVLEAMASGIPVVAANWGGPADYITADTGILLDPATPELFTIELCDAILKVAKDEQMRTEMGRAGRRRVEALYDWRRKAEMLLDIYNDTLRDASNRRVAKR
jgi:glycosyltransferase involved in cell wall biosynthesis